MTGKDGNVSPVEERPTTYNRSFQIVLIAAFVLVVIIMVYASLFRSAPRGQSVEKQVRQELQRQTPPGPEESFREQIKHREQRLQKQRELAEQRKPATAGATAGATPPRDEYGLQELLTPAKSPAQAWKENEDIRVRQSRQAAFNFEFFDAAGAAFADAPFGGAASQSREMDEFLLREQAALAGLRQRFDLDPAGATGAAAQAGASTQTVAAAAGGPDSARPLPLAGYPESDLAGAPDSGFELLSLGSVMRAKLDQKVISDYAGPYRCRIERNVMDVTQKFVLIPAGSLCVGEVVQTGNANPNRVINNRMALSVRWIVRPDGSKIKFLSQVLDHDGVGAVRGKTRYHLLARVSGTAAFALLSRETSRPDFSVGGSGATFESELGAALRRGGGDVASQYAGLAPTQTLNYGQKLRLFVSEDLYVLPWRGVYQPLLSQR